MRYTMREQGITFDGGHHHLVQRRKTGILRREGATKGGRWIVEAQH